MPTENLVPRLMDYKNHKIPLEEAREEAKHVLDKLTKIADDFCSQTEDKEDSTIRELLEDVSCKIMKIAIRKELNA